MLKKLGTETLKSGEKMQVCLLMPPAEELLDDLKELFQQYPEQARRDIFQRFQGDYAAECDDFYFIGLVDGEIAGLLWYGYAKNACGIANFGNVYTAPKHRKKGITNILMNYFSESFNGSEARAAFCTCGNPWIVSIYTKHGFILALPGTTSGFLMLSKDNISFTEFAENYYSKAQEKLSVIHSNIRQRHPVDTLFYFYKYLRPELFKPRIGLSSTVWNYQYALHRVEDGKGKLFTAETADGRVMGWAFCLNPVSPLEQLTGILDYEIHPEYAEFAPTFIRETALASKIDFEAINAQIPSFNADKKAAFEKAGFKQTGKSSQYGKFENTFFDLENFQIS